MVFAEWVLAIEKDVLARHMDMLKYVAMHVPGKIYIKVKLNCERYTRFIFNISLRGR